MLMLCPSLMSTDRTRRRSTKIPFSLPLSIATHRPWSKRNTICARDTSGWATRTSARRSRPMTTSWPGAKVRCDPSVRTVSAGIGAPNLSATHDTQLTSVTVLYKRHIYNTMR